MEELGGSVLKSLIGVLLCLLVGCGKSPSENSSVAVVIEMDRSSSASVSVPEPVEETLDVKLFSELILALEDVRKAKRVSGEVLLRADQLVLNQSFKQMELIGGVEVIRDEGKLSSELLRGWLSESGALRLLEAVENVCVVQEDRIGRGDWLQYDWMEQTVMLRGRASVSDAGVKLHGEQFSGRIGNAGRLICEPNAWLELDSLDHLQGAADIRARQAILDQSGGLIRFEGSVRVRGVYGALNCEELTIQRKEGLELDWLEAKSGVLFQYGDVMAKAECMVYNLNQDKLDLKGLPRVMQGRSVVRADSIQVWPKARRVICEPHAKAVLFPDQATWQAIQEELSVIE